MVASIMKAADVAKFTPTNYAQLAVHARGLIIRDMNKGILQNGRHDYKKDKNGVSKYADRKATGALGKFRKSDKVTMMLSGETKNRIRPEGKKRNAVLIFERGNIIRGNERHGYVIADLSKKNQNLTAKKMQDIVNMKIDKYNKSKPITIKIG